MARYVCLMLYRRDRGVLLFRAIILMPPILMSRPLRCACLRRRDVLQLSACRACYLCYLRQRWYALFWCLFDACYVAHCRTVVTMFFFVVRCLLCVSICCHATPTRLFILFHIRYDGVYIYGDLPVYWYCSISAICHALYTLLSFCCFWYDARLMFFCCFILLLWLSPRRFCYARRRYSRRHMRALHFTARVLTLPCFDILLRFDMPVVAAARLLLEMMPRALRFTPRRATMRESAAAAPRAHICWSCAQRVAHDSAYAAGVRSARFCFLMIRCLFPLIVAPWYLCRACSTTTLRYCHATSARNSAFDIVYASAYFCPRIYRWFSFICYAFVAWWRAMIRCRFDAHVFYCFCCATPPR